MTAEALADRQAIHDLLWRYARGVDGRDLAAVAACFTPDAAYDGALGCGTVQAALTSLAAAFERYAATRHVLANQIVVLEGDRAHSETDCLASHVLLPEAGGGRLTVAVRYADDLVRGAEGWRIARRRVETRWSRRDGSA